ncbi:MAG: adenosylcobinamide amidohydrolase [Methanosarcinaceae archaeon]|nr:adenosylcobinamide amidohydrolase [Methanosarcinaceae archaeon]
MVNDPKKISAAELYSGDCSPLPEEGTVLLFETSGGEKVYRRFDSIVVMLPGGRSTLTTSWVNGGYREDLQAIFNHHVPRGKHEPKDLDGGSIPAYIEYISKNLGLDPDRTSGLLTAACMENVAMVTRSFRGVEVTAIVTGGIEVNGGRVGDPASYYQEDGVYQFIQGTINTILLIGASLPAYSMARAIVTATEAKTAALQQLVAPSRYSQGIATGSGTDMIALVSDRSSPIKLTNAGKHSKLGEMIGLCVLEATLGALDKQSGLTSLYQRDMMVRLERFGVDEAMYWKAASKLEGQNRKGVFLKNLREFSRNPSLVGSTAAVLHILDEISWGLLPETAGRKTSIAIMKGLPGMLGCTEPVPFDDLLDEKNSLIDNWINITAWMVKSGKCSGITGR